MRNTLRLALFVVCTLSIGTASATDWLQWGYDAVHSGYNPDEHAITTGNVAQLTRRYQATLPSRVDSAPVYASGITTPLGVRDLLFLTAQNSTLFALDAADGSVVWSRSTTSTTSQSSPVIDPDRQFVYGYGGDGKVHKYAIGDGTEITGGGWPEIATLKPSVEKGAAGLTIATSGGVKRLYVVTDGYIGDGGDYQGHLTTIDLANGDQTVFNTLCSDITTHMVLNGQDGINDCSSRRNGIWGRPGAAYDPGTDRVYITTGNGPFDANTGGLDWGDSLLALNPDGTGAGAGLPLDSYTPEEFNELESGDTDLGSATLLVLQPPAGSAVGHLGLQTGKDSKLRLIDLDDMSGSGVPGGVGGEIQVIDVPISEFWAKTQPVTWVDSEGDGATWVYMANGNGISGLKLGLDASNRPFLLPTWQKDSSATSAIIANGIVYHAGSCSGGTCIIARDPRTGDALWTSPTIGSLHWQSPILVDGAIYIAAGTQLSRFDLGDTGTTYVVTPSAGAGGTIAPDTPQTVAAGDTTSFTVTPDAHYAIADVNGCGGSLDGSVYTTGPIEADCTVTATFAIITHTVTPEAGPGGSIAPDTPQTIDDGATVSFTLTPDTGYLIDGVSGCRGNLDGNVYTTGAVIQDCTVSATFATDAGDIVFTNGFDPPGG
ncbi:MAG TPA: PQQ-binding-like beta-propeller repeat protein [Rhodanobacteraceae bacterium]|nr:PQQ-binding-like beta-propeller repeat protein [Rhodanobacteraceae bacterium]